MKKIRKIINIIFIIIVISLITFIVAMKVYPKQTAEFVGFQTYVVLTDSMEPTIPTHSLIATKVIDHDEELTLKKGDIITFEADRFGDNILITHRFNKMEKNAEGTWCYRTNAEGKDNLDMYETKRSDIVGTYLFHIPYVGKAILFLQSPFGFLLYAELFAIWCINKLIQAKWEEKENDEDVKESKIKVLDTSFEKKEDFLNLHIYQISTTIKNTYLLPRRKIKVDIICYQNDEICFEKKDITVSKQYLKHNNKINYITTLHLEKEIDNVEVKVTNYHI